MRINFTCFHLFNLLLQHSFNKVLRTRVLHLLALTILLTLLFTPTLASAQTNIPPSIAVPATMNGRAMVVINGAAPRTMAIGQSHRGVRLTSIQGNRITFDVTMADRSIRSMTVNVGQTPVSLASSAAPMVSGNSEIILPIGQGGHFFATGYINNKSASFMVDTGATSIAMGQDEAIRLGIDYERGTRIGISTANGTTVGYRVQLRSVRIQGIEVSNVEAVVSPQPMSHILLGNSFLNRFDMTKTHNRLVLRRRY